MRGKCGRWKEFVCGFKQQAFTDQGQAMLPISMRAFQGRHNASASKEGLYTAKLLSIDGYALGVCSSADWQRHLDTIRSQAQVQSAQLDDAMLRMAGAKTGGDSIEMGAAAEM